jgi:hypothetical protein
VHQAQGDEDFPVGFGIRIVHGGFWHLAWLKSMEKVSFFGEQLILEINDLNRTGAAHLRFSEVNATSFYRGLDHLSF